MTTHVTGPKRIVVRASRETLGLVAAAVIATFALASVIHSRPQDPPPADPTEVQQDWAGHLSDVASEQVQTASVEPMTSASLVVPKSELSLPSGQNRPRSRACDQMPCTPKGPIPLVHARPDQFETAQAPVRKEHSLMSRLNPMNHLPDMKTLGRPFAYAGDAIVGWARRF